MNWVHTIAGHWQAASETWSAMVWRPYGQHTWSCLVFNGALPATRFTHAGFSELRDAQAWCEATIAQLQLDGR